MKLNKLEKEKQLEMEEVRFGGTHKPDLGGAEGEGDGKRRKGERGGGFYPR